MPRHSLIAIVILALVASAAYAETVGGSVREGNSLYREEKYEGALKKYKAAQVESPSDERIMFNLGNAQYRLDSHEEALSEYLGASLADDDQMEAHSHYNAGNALYRAGRLEEAVDQYLGTLELTPADEDAKHNLEFVRNEIRRRMERQQQRRQEQQKEKEKEQKESESLDGSGQPGEKDKESQQKNEQQQGEQPEKKESDRQKSDQPPKPQGADQKEQPEPAEQKPVPRQELSEKNLQRWLDSVEAETAENMKAFLRKQQPARVTAYPEDW